MASKTRKKGPLTSEEKVYIAERFLDPDRDVKWISKQLKRTENIVQKYIDKLNHVEKLKKKELPEKQKINATHQTGAATVLSAEGAALGVKKKKYVSPFRTR